MAIPKASIQQNTYLTVSNDTVARRKRVNQSRTPGVVLCRDLLMSISLARLLLKAVVTYS
jgi:hypothetical protein